MRSRLPATNPNQTSRRDLLKMSVGALALPAIGGLSLRSAAAADPPQITAVLSSDYLTGDLGGILRKVSNVDIQTVPYGGPSDSLAKLMAPGGTSRYDLMILNTDLAAPTVLGEKAGQERARPLDLSLIPNVKDLMPLFAKAVRKRDDKTYMIPVQWGYDSVLFDPAHIPESDDLTQSWGVLFSDKYAGKVALRDEPLQSIMAAGLSLGHTDVFNMNAADLKEVKSFLISKKKNIRALWKSFGEAVNMMGNGEVWAMYGWIAMRAELQKGGKNIRNNWPKEGAWVFNQSAFIPKDSSKAEAACAVINALLDLGYGLATARTTEYPSPSLAVKSALSIDEQKRIGYDIEERGVKLVKPSVPPDMNSWVSAWNDFKAA